MQLKEAIEARKSVRRFADKKPDWRKIIKAIDMARFAPMAGNLFSLKFILVRDKKEIEKIGEACQQDFVKTAHYIVVVVSDEEKVIRSYDEMGAKFAGQQAGAAIENFLLSLTAQGLATCWVGYFVEDQVKSVLKIPDKFIVEAIFPIGNPTKIPLREKSKPDLENIIYFDTWKNRYMKPRAKVPWERV